jgi:hypothetical protein
LAAHALLISRDGSVLGVSGDATGVAAPVGEYRLSSLMFSLADPAGGQPWNYIFSDSLRRGEPVWHKVEKDEALELDPLGTLDYYAELYEPLAERKRGERVTIVPHLYTGDGLIINAVYRGEKTTPGGDDGTQSRVVLRSGSGEVIERTSSGFS